MSRFLTSSPSTHSHIQTESQSSQPCQSGLGTVKTLSAAKGISSPNECDQIMSEEGRAGQGRSRKGRQGQERTDTKEQRCHSGLFPYLSWWGFRWQGLPHPTPTPHPLPPRERRPLVTSRWTNQELPAGLARHASGRASSRVTQTQPFLSLHRPALRHATPRHSTPTPNLFLARDCELW